MKTIKRALSLFLSIALVCTLALPALAAVHGDLDSDGGVTAADARRALRAAVQIEELTPEEALLADLDGDGNVTSSDARLILRTAVNLEDPDAFHRPSEADPTVCAVCGEEVVTRIRVGSLTLTVGGEDVCREAGLKCVAANTPSVASYGHDACYEDENGNVIYLVTDDEGKIRLCFVMGPSFKVNGVSSGDGVRKENLRVRLPEGTWLRFFTDVNDAERVWAAMLSERAEVPLLKPAVSADPEMEKIMFAFANALRGIHGLPAFREDAGLTDFSREHSADMGKNDYFDHTSPSGVTLKDRVLRAGYDYHTYAENIARGTLGMPYEIFSLWVNSTWHRKNLLSNNERSGVGLYITDDEKAVFYWTQFFLTEF